MAGWIRRGHDDLHISVIDVTKQTEKGLSRAFGIAVVAEAVQTALQDSPLIELGCAWAQGFHDGAVLDLVEAECRLPQVWAARCGSISHAGRTGLEGCPQAGG